MSIFLPFTSEVECRVSGIRTLPDFLQWVLMKETTAFAWERAQLNDVIEVPSGAINSLADHSIDILCPTRIHIGFLSDNPLY